MESIAICLNQVQSKFYSLDKTSNKINIGNIFAKREGYLNELTLFLAHFNSIPNFIQEINIDCKKANNWFLETYRDEIKDLHFSKRYFTQRSKAAEYDDIFYLLFDDLLVDFDTNQSIVRFLFRKTPITKIEEIIASIKKYKIKKKPKNKPEISVLVNTQYGLDTISLKIDKPKINIEHNYNNDFKEIHQNIYKKLLKKNEKGILLLYGKPGTGKTSYIRYLICSLKKQVIFLPPNLAMAIANPDFIKILINNPNSILVIEDAENIVLDREVNGCSPVSGLLNIADGLLSDCLNVQIICTFNTDISKIDNALLRKGRLIAKYEFRALEIEKAQALSQKIGFKSILNSPMTVAAIYNQDEQDFQNLKRNIPIGFKTIIANEK